MKIEDQLCSLELAKKLKKLGVNQESLFYWFECNSVNYLFCKYYEQYSNNTNLNIKDGYSAFTAAELGKILPHYVTKKFEEPFNNFRMFITRFYSVNADLSVMNNYILNYECDSTGTEGETAFLRRHLTNNIYDPNLANAMAKMLIYLIENDLIKKEE